MNATIEEKSDELARIVMDVVYRIQDRDKCKALIASQIQAVLAAHVAQDVQGNAANEPTSLDTRLLKAIAISSSVIQMSIASKLLKSEEYEQILSSVMEMIPND